MGDSPAAAPAPVPAGLSPNGLSRAETAKARTALLKDVLADLRLESWTASLLEHHYTDVKVLADHEDGETLSAAERGDSKSTAGGKKIVALLTILRRNNARSIASVDDGGYESLCKLLIACAENVEEHDGIAREIRTARRSAQWRTPAHLDPGAGASPPVAAPAPAPAVADPAPSARPYRSTPVDKLMKLHDKEGRGQLDYHTTPVYKSIETLNSAAKHEPPWLPDFKAVVWGTESGHRPVPRKSNGTETGNPSSTAYLAEGRCMAMTLAVAWSIRSDDPEFAHIKFKACDAFGVVGPPPGTPVYIGSKGRVILGSYDALRSAIEVCELDEAATSRHVRKWYKVRPLPSAPCRPFP